MRGPSAARRAFTPAPGALRGIRLAPGQLGNAPVADTQASLRPSSLTLAVVSPPRVVSHFLVPVSPLSALYVVRQENSWGSRLRRLSVRRARQYG